MTQPQASTCPSRPIPLITLTWACQVIAAGILAQTLYFKFTGAPETVALFEVIGLGTPGRLGTGVAELAAAVLLLIPRTAALGGLLSLGVISGAIMGHLTKLGISIDPVALGNPALEPLKGPTLFGLAVIVFAASAIVVAIRRREIPILGPKLFPRRNA